MSLSSNKKKDIIFYIILVIVCLLIIGVTVYFIVRNNNNLEETNNTPSNSKVNIENNDLEILSIREKQQVNPVEIIKNSNNTFSLSGLKNKDVTNKINNYMNELYNKNDNSVENDYNNCTMVFNYNNILSLRCGSYRKLINLIDGEPIVIEDLVTDMNAFYAFLSREYIESQQTYYEFYDEYYQEWFETYDYDAATSAFMKDVKNNDYELSFWNYSGFIISTKSDDALSFNVSDIKDILSYSKFLTNEDIYENDVTYDYLFYYERENTYFTELINDKTLVYYSFYDYSEWQVNYDGYKESILDEERFLANIDNIKNIINDKMISKSNKYQIYSVNATIYYYDTKKSQIILTANYIDADTSSGFDYYILENNPYSDKYNKKIIANIFLDKDNNIIYLNDNPYQVLDSNVISKVYEENPDYAIAWAIDEETRSANYYTYDFAEAYSDTYMASIPY